MTKTKELQQKSLAICDMIYAVCKKNNIPCFLAAGTLLGAVREKGFIPWDDDIDLEIFRDDYKRFLNVIQKELGDRLLIQCYKTDSAYPFPFIKIYLKCEENAHLRYPDLNRAGFAFVDVFPIGRCPQNSFLSRSYFKIAELLTVVINSKFAPEGVAVCGYEKRFARILFWTLRIFPSRFLQWLNTAVADMAHKFSSGKVMCYAGGKYGYPGELYLGKWYDGEVPICFEGNQYSAPIGWDELLQHKYGDYLILPDEDNRKGHYCES